MPVGKKDHFLLNRLAGWRAGAMTKTELPDGGAGLRLRCLPGMAHPLTDASGDFGGLSEPSYLAVDEGGNLYILDRKDLTVRRFDVCTKQFATLACIGGEGCEPRRLRDPHAIGISCRGDLFVADSGNRRIQIFSLKGLVLRQILGPYRVVRGAGGKIEIEPAQPKAADVWTPWGLAVAERGWFYVTDYANGVVHIFDAGYCWRAAFAGEIPGDGPLVKPTAIALDRKGWIYVVQKGRNYVAVFDGEGTFQAKVTAPDDIVDRFCPVAVAVDDQGNLHISDAGNCGIQLYDTDDCGCYRHVGRCGEFIGLATDLVFDSDGNPIVSDAKSKTVVLAMAKAIFEASGDFVSGALDSRIYRCHWDRVVLHGNVPVGTLVRVAATTAETEKTQQEIADLPADRWFTGQVDAVTGYGSWDCLLQCPPGRYLWLRLTLEGDGTDTSELDWVRVYAPRNSTVRYLPAVYREDPLSESFLERFLAIYERTWERLGDRITTIASLFDAASTPANCGASYTPDFLSWLAGWIGLALDRHWPVAQRRLLVENAYKLYRLRGTPAGLRLHLKLYTGVEPLVLEHFKLRRWLFVDSSRLGGLSALWGADIVKRLELDVHSTIGTFVLTDAGDPLRDPFYQSAHQFTVYLPMRRAPDATQTQTIQRIVEMAKPAHTLGTVEITLPRMRVGLQAFVGVNTVIGEYPSNPYAGQTVLGRDSVLAPAPGDEGHPTMRIGATSRIGVGTLLD
jgi:phage tail-like protein